MKVFQVLSIPVSSDASAGHDFVTVAACGSDIDRVQPLEMDTVPGKPMNPGPWKSHWFKPAGDVYRSSPQDKYFPTQGIAIADTTSVQVIKDNTFMYFYSENDDAYRNAIGINYGSSAPVSPKNCYIGENGYVQTPRQTQMAADLPCTRPDCDEYSLTSHFGTNFGTPAQFRDLGDAEKSMGYIDYQGLFRRVCQLCYDNHTVMLN